MENILRHTKRYELVELNGSYLVFDKLLSEVKGAYKTLRGADLKFNRLNRRIGINTFSPLEA